MTQTPNQIDTPASTAGQPKSVFVAETALFAALYAALTLLLAPLSFQMVQVRLSDCLIPLSAVFGWPAIAGVTIGCLVANLYAFTASPLALFDVIFGSLANAAASMAAYILRRRPLASTTAATLIITGVVGSYLPLVWPVPGAPQALYYLGVLIGSTISIILIGYPLIHALLRIPLPPHIKIQEPEGEETIPPETPEGPEEQ